MKTLQIAILGLKGSGKTSLVKKLQQKVEYETEDLSLYSFKSGDTLIYLSDAPYDISKIKPVMAIMHEADAHILCISATEGINQALGELILLMNFSNCQNGVVALTKVDSVDPDVIDTLKSKIKGILSQTPMKNFSIITTSDITEEGLTELREALISFNPIQRDTSSNFKMSVELAQEVKAGLTSVLGVIEKGTTKKYHKVSILPWGKEFVVQEVNVNGEIKETAKAGDRVSLLFKGLYPWDVQMGDIITDGNFIKKSKKVRINFTVSSFYKDELRNGGEVDINIGLRTNNAIITSISKGNSNVESAKSGEEVIIDLESKLPFAFEEGQTCVIINPSANWKSIKVAGSGKVKEGLE